MHTYYSKVPRVRFLGNSTNHHSILLILPGHLARTPKLLKPWPFEGGGSLLQRCDFQEKKWNRSEDVILGPKWLDKNRFSPKWETTGNHHFPFVMTHAPGHKTSPVQVGVDTRLVHVMTFSEILCEVRVFCFGFKREVRVFRTVSDFCHGFKRHGEQP